MIEWLFFEFGIVMAGRPGLLRLDYGIAKVFQREKLG